MNLIGPGTAGALRAFADHFSGGATIGAVRTGATAAAPRARSPFIAGLLGGVVVVVVTGLLAAVLLRRRGPQIMPRLMQRMMRGGTSEAMRACMERCGCGPSPSDEPAGSLR